MNNFKESLHVLNRTPQILKELLRDGSEGWRDLNEGENTWSPARVLCDLLRGDRAYWIENFRVIIEQRPYAFAAFPKQGQFDDIDSFTINQLLDEFASIRKKNLEEVSEASLSFNDLLLVGHHANLGRVQLKELMSAWAVHDLGHINQIIRVIAKGFKSNIGPWQPYLDIVNL